MALPALARVSDEGREGRGVRKLAATFWSGNRSLLAAQSEIQFEELGRKPPLSPDQIATGMIALDIGLAVQHLVDPDAVPLDSYVSLYDGLFGPMLEPEG